MSFIRMILELRDMYIWLLPFCIWKIKSTEDLKFDIYLKWDSYIALLTWYLSSSSCVISLIDVILVLTLTLYSFRISSFNWCNGRTVNSKYIPFMLNIAMNMNLIKIKCLLFLFSYFCALIIKLTSKNILLVFRWSNL